MTNKLNIAPIIIEYTLFSNIYGIVMKNKQTNKNIYQGIKQVTTNFKELKSDYALSPLWN